MSIINLQQKSENKLNYNIKLDYSRDSLFDTLGLTRLKESYMREDEKSPQERFAYVSKQFASNQEHAQRLYDYSSKHWLSYATPILSFGRNRRGMPISCFLNHLSDTAEGLVNTLSETNWLSMMGGGVGTHVKIRGADEKSVGVMPHLKVYDSSSLAYKQGTTRRGSYAMYLDISHPDIIQFLEMRKPTGDQNMRTLNLNHGINITDDFMQIIEKCMIDPNYNDIWGLKQPNTGQIVETISAKELWARILEMRMQTGEPYLEFIDTANAGLPQYQKDKGLKIHGSNLCVSGDTLVDVLIDSVPFYQVRIDFVISEHQLGKTISIKSKNLDTNKIEYKPILASAQTSTKAKVIKLKVDGKELILTPDHQVWTKNRGYVRAIDLKPDDDLDLTSG